MRRRGLAIVATLAGALTFSSGCFPSTGQTGGTGGSGGAGGGSVGFTKPTFELTVGGVHFGPSAPDTGSTASLVTTRDATTGAVSDSTFRISGTLASAGAGCAFTFDRFGGAIGVGQYTVSSASSGSTPDGAVYPTGGERVETPEGGASCAGTACDGGALVITAIDGAHVYGYVQETMAADNGAGVAAVVCTFYLPMAQYQP